MSAESVKDAEIAEVAVKVSGLLDQLETTVAAIRGILLRPPAPEPPEPDERLAAL